MISISDVGGLNEKRILKEVLNELIANDKYELTWSYDYPQLKIHIDKGLRASKMIYTKVMLDE